MAHTFTRNELYDLVWSEPMRRLAKRYSISDRGLAKACVAANIPVPERGYWNKVHAGKKVHKRGLPSRSLGQSEDVFIGGNSWSRSYESDEEILSKPIPPVPTFENTIEEIKTQVTAMVNKAPLPKNISNSHRLILKLLDQDEVRHQKQISSPYSFVWDGPIFRMAFEMRRLKILNALFVCLDSCGMKTSVSGREARDLSVTVGSQCISFLLDSADVDEQLGRERAGYAFATRGDKDRMRLTIGSRHSCTKDAQLWEDNGKDIIESHLREIVAYLIVLGEERYRENCIYQRERLISRKEEILEERRIQKIEAKRRHLAHIAKMEKMRVDHLLSQAADLHKAKQIRDYVASVQEANKSSSEPMSPEDMTSWKEWALAQADRIDPVLSGSYKARPGESDEDYDDE